MVLTPRSLCPRSNLYFLAPVTAFQLTVTCAFGRSTLALTLPGAGGGLRQLGRAALDLIRPGAVAIGEAVCAAVALAADLEVVAVAARQASNPLGAGSDLAARADPAGRIVRRSVLHLELVTNRMSGGGKSQRTRMLVFVGLSVKMSASFGGVGGAHGQVEPCTTSDHGPHAVLYCVRHCPGPAPESSSCCCTQALSHRNSPRVGFWPIDTAELGHVVGREVRGRVRCASNFCMPETGLSPSHKRNWILSVSGLSVTSLSLGGGSLGPLTARAPSDFERVQLRAETSTEAPGPYALPATFARS